MNYKSYIFTEIISTSPVGNVMLKSFVRHHPEETIHVYCTQDDYSQLDAEVKGKNITPFFLDEYPEVLGAFRQGHLGTAMVFAMAFGNAVEKGYTHVIHIDSDVFFRKESLSLIALAFEEGYHIAGSRRAYKNNPANIPVADGIPDAISTYFTGYSLEYYPKGFTFGQFTKMWQGAYNPLGHEVFDFGDPICFMMLNHGAKIKFIESDLIGGQNEAGKKDNKFTLNLHMDCGSHLIHFGGAGSGYVYSKDNTGKNKSYGEWALIRWQLFNAVFFGRLHTSGGNTVYGPDGRWVSGGWNDAIFNEVIKNLSTPDNQPISIDNQHSKINNP